MENIWFALYTLSETTSTSLDNPKYVESEKLVNEAKSG